MAAISRDRRQDFYFYEIIFIELETRGHVF